MQNGVVFEVVLTAGLGLAGLLLKVVGKFPVIRKCQNISIKYSVLIFQCDSFFNSVHFMDIGIEWNWMYVHQNSIAANLLIYLVDVRRNHKQYFGFSNG